MSLIEKNEFKQIGGPGSEQYQAESLTVNKITLERVELRSEAMKRLIEAYHVERQKGGDPSFTEFIKKLNHYITVIDDEFIGIEKKLSNGGYDNDIEWASRLKQSYYKELEKTKFFPATQKIHAYLLAKIFSLFNQFVYPAIKSNMPQEQVKEILNRQVIEPIDALINTEENVLDLYIDDINAMVYYLTGNCHLKWS